AVAVTEAQHDVSEAVEPESVDADAPDDVAVAEAQHAEPESAEPESVVADAPADVAVDQAQRDAAEADEAPAKLSTTKMHATSSAFNWTPRGLVQTEFSFGEYTVYDYSSKLETINDLKNEIRELRKELTDLIAAIRQAHLITPEAPKETQPEAIAQHGTSVNEVIPKHSASNIAKAILPIHNQAPQQELVANKGQQEKLDSPTSNKTIPQNVGVERVAASRPSGQATGDAVVERNPLDHLKEVVAYHVSNGVSFDGIKYAAIQQEDVKSSIKEAILERGDLISRMLAKPEETKAECYHIMRQSRLPTNVAIGAAIDLNSNNPKLEHLNVEAIKEYTYSTMIGLHDDPAPSLVRDYLNGNKDELTLYNELVELLGEENAAAYKPLNNTENTTEKELNQKIEQYDTPVPM
ncbi:hypothetical protein ABXZ88_003179, partial [Vibrio fluvialis]